MGRRLIGGLNIGVIEAMGVKETARLLLRLMNSVIAEVAAQTPLY